MRRRIDIAASLVTRPEILFLDEPTTGLDPRSRNQVWDLVRQIAADGTTVLLTTQYLEEADRLAERMAVIDHGRVIAEGTSRELKASIGSNALHVHLGQPRAARAGATLIAGLLGDGVLPTTDAGAISVKVADAAAAADVLGALARAKIPVTDFSLGAPSLDDVFFALTGRAAENQGRRRRKGRPLVSSDAISSQPEALSCAPGPGRSRRCRRSAPWPGGRC